MDLAILSRSIFYSLLFAHLAFEADKNAVLGVNSFEARRNARKILAQEPNSLETEAEKASWSQALLASVALERLEGDDAAALKLLARCGDICGKFGSEKDWRAEMAWACAKKKETSYCLPESTKAQKPPH